MANSERNDDAAALVGRLIRSYREDGRRNGRRLSQDGLLDLMVERGEGYAANLDRVNISYWETGARLAPREFLIALGRTFDIPQGEMDRILSFAGYDNRAGSEQKYGGGGVKRYSRPHRASSPGWRVSGKTFAT